MSESFFDRLAKGMSGAGSRRQALKAMGGVLAGSLLLGLTGTARAEEEDPCRDCCSRDCRSLRDACNDACRALEKKRCKRISIYCNDRKGLSVFCKDKSGDNGSP